MGFEPTQLALVELESTPLDHSGKLSLSTMASLASSLQDLGSASDKNLCVLPKSAFVERNCFGISISDLAQPDSLLVDQRCGKLHQPGIEPGSHRWQRCILALDH